MLEAVVNICKSIVAHGNTVNLNSEILDKILENHIRQHPLFGLMKFCSED